MIQFLLMRKTINHYWRQVLLVLIFFILSSMMIVGLFDGIKKCNEIIVENRYNNIKIDFSLDFSLSTLTSQKVDEIENQLIEDPIEEYPFLQGSFLSFNKPLSNLYLDLNNSELDWNLYNNIKNDIANQNYSNLLIENVEFRAFSPSLFNLHSLENIISVKSEDYTLLDENDVYIDEFSASRLNLTIGQKISIGAIVYQELTDENRSLSNITIKGIFKILNYNAFNEFFNAGSIFASSEQHIEFLFQNVDFIHVVPYFTSYGFNFPIKIGYYFNKSSSEFDSFESSTNTIKSFKNQLSYLPIYSEILPIYHNDLYYEINAVKQIATITKFIGIIVSIPILFLSYFLINSIYNIYFSKRLREISILKTRNFSIRKIETNFFGELLGLGSFGGFIGSLLGNFTSGILLVQYSFKMNQKFPNIIEFLFSDNKIDPLSILIGVGIGISMAIVIFLNKIENIQSQEVSRGLLKHGEPEISTRWSKKKNLIFLITSILLLVVSLFLIEANVNSSSAFLYIVFYNASLIWKPFIPIYIIYAVSNYSDYIYGIFLKIKMKLVKKKFSDFNILFNKYEISNKNLRTQLIFIISIIFSFFIQSSIIISTQNQYSTDLVYQYQGADCHVIIDNNENLLNIDYYCNNFTNNQELSINSISEITWVDNFQYDDNFYSNVKFNWGLINISHFDLNVDMSKIVGNFSSQASLLQQLNTLENSTLVPTSFLKNTGLKIGDTIDARFFNYENENHMVKNYYDVKLVIIGSYSMFPGIPPVSVNSEMPSISFLSSKSQYLHENIDFESFSLYFDFIIDNKTNQEKLVLTEKLKTYISEKFPEINYFIYPPDNLNLSLDQIEIVLTILNLEKIYITILIFIGIGFLLYYFLHHNSDIDYILIIRGIPRKWIQKIHINEIILIIATSLFIGFIAVLTSIPINILIADINYVMTQNSAISQEFSLLHLFTELAFIFIYLVASSTLFILIFKTRKIQQIRN